MRDRIASFVVWAIVAIAVAFIARAIIAYAWAEPVAGQQEEAPKPPPHHHHYPFRVPSHTRV
jgi:hypothetical protein